MDKNKKAIHRKMHIYFSLQAKLGLSFSILTIVTSAMLTLTLYQAVRGRLREDIRQRLYDIVNVSSLQVDGDKHATLVDPAQEGNTTYMHIKSILQNIRDKGTDIRYVYTWRRKTNGQLIFVVDAETNPEKMSHLGDVYVSAEPALLATLATLDHTVVDEKFTTDEWGVWLSGYAPFYRSDGQMEGILGIDIAASNVILQERHFLWIALGVFSATIPMALILGWLIGRKLAAPIARLKIGSERIAEGDLNHRVVVQSNDEVGSLAKSFNRMTDSLQKTITDRDQEIVERKRVEKELKANNQQLRELAMIVEQTVEGVAVTDREGKLRFVNTAWAKMHGYGSNDELIGKNLSIFHTREQMKTDVIPFNNKVKRTGSERGEIGHMRKDGTAFPTEMSVTLFKDESGKPVGLIGLTVDISSRKIAEEKIKVLSSAVENAYDSFILTDMNGKVTYANRACIKNFGYSPDEITKLNMSQFTANPDDAKKIKDELKKKSSWNGELIQVRKNKKEFLVMLTTSLVKDDKENPMAMMAIFRDITERKRAEHAIETLNRDLESTVQDLTVANRELKEFAYIVAHDLKSPVRAIGSLAGMISNDRSNILNEQSKQQLDMLVQRTERMNEFINGILKYSTLGHVAVQKKKVDMNDVVNWVIDQVGAQKETIEITVENELPVVMSQRAHMTQIFQNLLDNAIKYMDKPKGQIKIGCVEKDDYWEFSVADNGPGIEERYFDKIFQIFQRITRRDEIEGTGIGLSLVRKIVELYSGQVWVKSKIGEGSTFFFTLPKQETGIKNEELYANIVS